MYRLEIAQAYHEYAESLAELFTKLSGSEIVAEDGEVVSVDISYLSRGDEPALWTATVVTE